MNINYLKDNTIPFIQDDGSFYFLLVTPKVIIPEIISFFNLKEGDIFIDLGSGDGRIVIEATKRYNINSVGIELNEELCEYSKKQIYKNGLINKVKIVNDTFLDQNLGNADAIFMYFGFEESSNVLDDKLEKELKKSCQIFTLNFKLKRFQSNLIKTIHHESGNYNLYFSTK